jgi:hypothetical protein
VGGELGVFSWLFFVLKRKRGINKGFLFSFVLCRLFGCFWMLVFFCCLRAVSLFDGTFGGSGGFLF